MKCYGLIDFIGVTTLPNRKNPQDGDYLVVAILDGLDSRKFFVDDQVYRVSRDRPWWNQVLSSPACVCSLKAYIRQLQLNQEA